jgi:hypothetical protein
MRNQKETIRKLVGFLNNREEGGGCWLPNIQRPFVWSEEQICRLFDSILRRYPISTLLVWKTKSPLRRRKFIENWTEKTRSHLSDFYVPEDNNKKTLVLDGQQRLQSLFIALCGSYEGKELHFNILSGKLAEPDDIKYEFAFLPAAEAKFPMVRFKDLIFTEKRNREVAGDIENYSGRALTAAEKDKVDDHLELVDRCFKMDEVITYQELDSVDAPKLYSEDDIVEIFIRANSGGTKLGKSDLLFSLLAVAWEHADTKVEELREELNRHGFKFDRDFILKTCLVVLDQGARYEVEKFRKPGVRETIEEKWERIASAITAVLDFVRDRTFIQSDRALPSYLVLIPLIYLRYHFEDAFKEAKDLDAYLLRSSLTGAFGSSPDNLIDALVKKISETRAFDVDQAFDVIRNQGRTLEVTEDRFWSMGYGSETIHLLFNLWYRGFNHTPSYANNRPEVDHVFPKSVLRTIKAVNPRTGRKDVLRYHEEERNQLANCMLLSREENGGGGKSDTLPEVWFNGKSDAYLDMHLIPRNPELWKLDNFDAFLEERKKLLRKQFAALLLPPTGSGGTSARP